MMSFYQCSVWHTDINTNYDKFFKILQTLMILMSLKCSHLLSREFTYTDGFMQIIICISPEWS